MFNKLQCQLAFVSTIEEASFYCPMCEGLDWLWKVYLIWESGEDGDRIAKMFQFQLNFPKIEWGGFKYWRKFAAGQIANTT